MKRIVMILMAVALVALPTMAQGFASKNTDERVQPAFQSTSTMAPVNSQYSAQPMLNADGTAYNPAEAAAPSGPRKVTKDGGSGVPTTPDGTQGEQPVGDAVLPLMLMALAFCGIVALRRRRALNR